MRIALFSGNYNYLREGANQALNRLVDYLEKEAGHSVRVYSPVGEKPAFEPAGTLVPVPSITLPVRSEFQLALGLPVSIRRDIQVFAPDIVHVATPDILDTRAQTFAKRLGVPIVASQHTLFETYLDHYGLGWLRPVLKAHLNRFYRRSDHVLAPTPPLVTAMKRLRGDDRVSLWSRGVDGELFNPARRDEEWRRSQGWARDDVVILFFGRLVREKGVEDYISILSELQSRNLRISALVIGDGPARAAFGSLPGVLLTGHLTGDALARAVASADLLLHPSITEAFGNVVLEAMACGLTVLATDTPSARSLLDQDRTGLLCPPGDLKALSAMLACAVASSDLRVRLGTAARAASELYTWDHASASVERAYRQVLEETNGLLRARDGRTAPPAVPRSATLDRSA